MYVEKKVRLKGYVIVTHPEMGHAVDLHSLLYMRVWRLQELFPCDNAGIVHQNSDVTHFTFDLKSQANSISFIYLLLDNSGLMLSLIRALFSSTI